MLLDELKWRARGRGAPAGAAGRIKRVDRTGIGPEAMTRGAQRTRSGLAQAVLANRPPHHADDAARGKRGGRGDRRPPDDRHQASSRAGGVPSDVAARPAVGWFRLTSIAPASRPPAGVRRTMSDSTCTAP